MEHVTYENMSFKIFIAYWNNLTFTNASLNETLSFSYDPQGVNTPLEIALKASGIMTVILLMIASGSRVKSRDLLQHLKRPWSILVGMACQYILLPFLAFCVILLFSLEPNQAVAVMITSTSPGGPFSNLGTIAVGGDVSLRWAYAI